MDLATGPYKGKETGESALLRSLLGSLAAGDIVVMDRYYCSFMMIALLLSQGTHTCARKHHLRHSDFRRGKRLGKYDHLIVWTRPQRPTWMDEETYARIPETLILRELRFNIVEPGRRTHAIDIITTLTDADEYTKEDIAELYGFRWNSELDIRSIKSNLNLAHVRCKSPERPLQIAGDGSSRTVDDDLGLQSDSLHIRRRRPVTRKTASPDQLYEQLPVCACVVDAIVLSRDR
jgi:hypothetical protein